LYTALSVSAAAPIAGTIDYSHLSASIGSMLAALFAG
jgi:hypothetical protein